MMIDHLTPWMKTYERTIDQRDLALPPTWSRLENRAPRTQETGQHVHVSGRNREVARRLVALLDIAKQRAVVSSFLLADEEVEDAMLEAAQRGVRIYVLLATEARLGREHSDGEFDQRVLSQHTAMLTRLGGHVLFRSAPHFHAKMILIDPDDRPAGVLLTANLTSEALERNEELAVELTQIEVRDACALAGWAMWETAEHEMVDPEDRLRSVKPLGRLQHPDLTSGITATTPERSDLRDHALRIVDSAESRLIVSSFGWEKDHAVVKKLCTRAREGVSVTVLARVRERSMPALIALAEAGARIVGFRWLHAKAIWADTGEAMIMSANLESRGLDQGFEVGVLLKDNRADEVRTRLEAWIGSAQWRLQTSPMLGDVNGDIRVWYDKELKEMVMESKLDVSLGELTSSSADDLAVPEPTLPKMNGLPRFAHELHCVWTVSAPTLSPKAKEKRRQPTQKKSAPTSYDPPVFKEPGGRLVVAVRSPSELPAARVIKEKVGAVTIVVADEARSR